MPERRTQRDPRGPTRIRSSPCATSRLLLASLSPICHTLIPRSAAVSAEADQRPKEQVRRARAAWALAGLGGEEEMTQGDGEGSVANLDEHWRQARMR